MEEDILQGLTEYFLQKHGHEFQSLYDRFIDDCPVDFRGLDKDGHVKTFLQWLMLEKPLPGSGRRLIEEYADDHPELGEQEREKILGMKNVVVSRFVVIAKDRTRLIVKDQKTGTMYPVVLLANIPDIAPNTLIQGRIFPYGKEYRLSGAFLVANSPMILDPDIFMHAHEKHEIEKIEGMILSPSSRISAIVNKYPSQWVDGMCEALGVDERLKSEKAKAIASTISKDIGSIYRKLPEESRNALQQVMRAGGLVRYNELKAFDDEISFWWTEHPPASAIGILRLHGLLAVGKMPTNGRMYKVAVIPKDVREAMKGWGGAGV